MKKLLFIGLLFLSTNLFAQSSKYIVVESLNSERNYKKCTMKINVDDGVNPIAISKREYCSFVKLIEEFESKGYELDSNWVDSRVVAGINIPSTWFLFKRVD